MNFIFYFDVDSIEEIKGVGMGRLTTLDHVHNFDGKCLKNRYGVKCEVPSGNQ